MDITVKERMIILLLCKITPQNIVEDILLYNIGNKIRPSSDELENIELEETINISLTNNEINLLKTIIRASSEVTDDIYELYKKINNGINS